MALRCNPVLIAALMALAGCQAGGKPDVPGDPGSPAAFDGIGVDEEVRFLGNEPFWGGSARGAMLTYTTPEDQAGQTVPVKRFGGRGGLSLSGTIAGKPFDMTITPGACSDGMSDRGYPFVVTLRIADETRNGCGWTSRQPFTGPASP